MNKYEAILSVPYSAEHNCRWAVCQALTLVFWDFEEDEIPTDKSAVQFLTGKRVSRWRKLGDAAVLANRLGDVIYGEREPGHPYVAAMVDPVGHNALTSNVEKRKAHLIATSKMEGVLGVYRRS